MYLSLETLMSTIKTLIYSGGTDTPGEFCNDFSFSNNLFHIFNFPTRISVSDSHSPALLNFYLPFNPKTYSTAVAFSLLANSVHAVV